MVLLAACDVAELSDDVIDITAEHAMRIRSPLTTFPIWQMGGAVARVGDDDTAFNGRTSGTRSTSRPLPPTAEGFDEERQWVRDFWTALAPYHTGVYVNFLMDEGEERVREAYGAAKYDRLKALKRKYDPDNFFGSTRTSRRTERQPPSPSQAIRNVNVLRFPRFSTLPRASRPRTHAR